MARIQTSWFEFNGRKSSDLGVRLMDAHSFCQGELRGSWEEVAGRDGAIWLGDGATDAIEIKRACMAPATKLRQIAAWLSGAGGLRFSSEESAMYDARVMQKIDFRRAAPGADPLYAFTVCFSCQPHPRLWPEAEPLEIAISGAQITNPGAAIALPRVEIEGSGSFSLTIGKQTMFFTGVEDGIIVDSELRDALTADGALLANDQIAGDFFEIQPGVNGVQWLNGGPGDDADESGAVRRVIITPRWRCV